MSPPLFEPLESCTLLDAALVEFRVNQVGYLPDEKKVVLVCSDGDLTGQTVEVVDSDGAHQISVTIGRDHGVYGPWGHLYEIDLSKLTESGRYHLKLGDVESVGFTINANVYKSLVSTTLAFFQVLRSGNTNPKDLGPSHLTDGTAKGGPVNGQHIDATRVRYDAGDYLKFTLPGVMAASLMLTAWFADTAGATTRPASAPLTQPSAQARAAAWNKVNDFVYQLQNADLTAIGKTKFDFAVIDYSADGSDMAQYTKQQINALQNSPGGKKHVLSYMSIGEAEDYRWYWQKSWDANHDGKPDAGAPSWLGPVDPDWAGNYKVKYWDPAWQKIVFDYEDKVIAAGFDGVYLDIIDAYEFWQPGGEGKPGRASAEQDMVDFVKAIATHARETDGVKDFAVFVQNGADLARHPDYVATVTGIGQEDLFFNGNKKQPADETNYIIPFLNAFKDAGKPVLVIDYPTQANKIDEVYTRAQRADTSPTSRGANSTN